MFRQLMTTNRFVSLAPDDPDNSETETEPAEPRITDKPQDDVSAVSDDTVFYDANADTPYFQAGTEPPPREQWEVAAPINFHDVHGVLRLSHQLDETFRSVKEIETPLGMDSAQQMWKWADVGACQMPRAPPAYPTLMVGKVERVNQLLATSTIKLFSSG
jgi:hypothetical protein